MELMTGWHMGYHLCSSLGYTNGFKAGYRRSFVYIVSQDSAHAVICFNTTDHGLVL
ncbi:MAG: hypothetical protein N3F10_06400 [Candidatus Bathyarchaeota archaeon]|nr:hypothetical protein [Candidatus Bathyarchaeota archaeon]